MTWEPQQWLLAYLAVYQFCLGLTLGALLILMLHQLTGGAWGRPLRRPLQAMVIPLPLLAVLFVPVLLGLHSIYRWTQPEIVAADELLRHKQWYLNIPFFVIRAGIYFAVWLGFAGIFLRWTAAWEHGNDPAAETRLRRLSAGGLLVLGLTLTFAAVDWIAALVPAWSSSTFGLLVAVGHALSAMALAILCLALFPRYPDNEQRPTPALFQDWGSLLLMYVLAWAYLAFMQYLTIWTGNQVREIGWYLPRVQSSWQYLGLLIILFHVVVPFMLLLFRRIKRSAATLASIALLVLIGHLAHAFWLVIPSFRADGFSLYWTDGLALLVVAGPWTGIFLRRLRQPASLAVNSTPEATAHGE